MMTSTTTAIIKVNFGKKILEYIYTLLRPELKPTMQQLYILLVAKCCPAAWIYFSFPVTWGQSTRTKTEHTFLFMENCSTLCKQYSIQFKKSNNPFYIPPR